MFSWFADRLRIDAANSASVSVIFDESPVSLSLHHVFVGGQSYLPCFNSTEVGTVHCVDFFLLFQRHFVYVYGWVSAFAQNSQQTFNTE